MMGTAERPGGHAWQQMKQWHGRWAAGDAVASNSIIIRHAAAAALENPAAAALDTVTPRTHDNCVGNIV